ncbi:MULTISPECIES: DUF5707 domain-containing protein [Streptomyces]|uniref:DUF5707 domain-containing protein n=1 Tax=Streptomyces chilikensis TaxID=1194079 RepID=A0ABV3EU30_9ACTN|nr:DUF5707 domain-containing protein [Streptomyces sp. MJP52]
MSRRTVVLSVVTAALVLGGAGAFAVARTADEPPVLAESSVRYTAPTAERDGSVAFRTEVTAPSGVKSLKVLAWPEDGPFSEDELTAKDMAEVESADCAAAEGDTVVCAYEVPVTTEDLAGTVPGTWHVATLATAEDGTTAFADRTATFTTR